MLTECKAATVAEDFMFSSVRQATIRKLSNEYRKLSAKPALTETNAKTASAPMRKPHQHQCGTRISSSGV